MFFEYLVEEMTPSRVRSRWDMTPNTPNMNQTPARGGFGGMSVLKETPTPGHMGLQTPVVGETPTPKRQMRGRWDEKGLGMGETPTGQTPGMITPG